MVKGTLLEVYSAYRVGKDSVKLELLTQQRLFGVVESLAVLRSRGGRSGRDAILLAFRDAKLSVLQWDAATSDVAPSSLHYFEGDESLKAGREAFSRPPMVVTDPAGRCAAVIMLRHQLAVLPATESESAALGMMAGDDLFSTGPPTGMNMNMNMNMNNIFSAGGETTTAAVGNSYVDNLSKMNIREIRDAVFLHGCAEPTLLVLHEGDPTWPGNLKRKKDTCSLTALSLNLTAKRHPRIWEVQNVPADAYRVISVPTGGVLVLCTTMILYYAQGHQAGIVLHSAALPAAAPPPPLGFDMGKQTPGAAAAQYARDHGTELHPLAATSALSFCDASTAGWNLECDAAHAAWISRSTALLGLKTGQLLLVEVARGGGGVVRLHVGKAGAAPIAAVLTALSSSVVFIGSAGGDSLLVGCSLSSSSLLSNGGSSIKITTTTTTTEEEARESKRRRLESEDTDTVAAAGNAGAVDAVKDAAITNNGDEQEKQQKQGEQKQGGYDSDEDALVLYGTDLDGGENNNNAAALPSTSSSSLSTSSKQLKCALRVLDSFIGIGPIRSMASSASSGAATSSSSSSSMASGGGKEAPYMVACCGKDKGGALAVLRRCVAPDVVTEVPLPGVAGVWAVGGNNNSSSSSPLTNSYHDYLLLSFTNGSTKVLSTGGDDDELKDVTESVEFAGDVPTLAAGTVYQGRRIVQAFPQGLRVLEQGQSTQDIWAAELAASSSSNSNSDSSDTENVELVAVHFADPFVLAHLSNGTAKLLQVDPEKGGMLEVVGDIAASAHTAAVTACCLFTDSCGWLQRNFVQAGLHCCFVAFSDGSCSMWTLSDIAAPPFWRCSALAEGAVVLVAGTPQSASAAALRSLKDEGASIVELRMESFEAADTCRPDLQSSASRPACAAPVLVAVTADNCLLTYKAFSCAPGAAQASDDDNMQHLSAHESLRFKRLTSVDIPALVPPPAAATTTAITSKQQQRLFRFEGLGEQIPHCGIFVSGTTPLWLIASRGTLFSHPHHMSAGVTTIAGFTPFHNVNSPHAFITVCTGTATSCIQISELPPRQRLDAPWPRQKIAIKATPHRVCFYAEAQLFVVAASRSVPYTPYLPEEEGGEPQASYSYALGDAANVARGTQTQHDVRLVEPGTWATLWQYALLPGEMVLCVESCHLRDETTGSTVPLLAVGVGFAAGEDYPCSGRVLLFEVRRKSMDMNTTNTTTTTTPLPEWSAQVIYAREFKGPVTGVATMEGHLLLSTGHRLEICTLSSTTTTTTATTTPEDDDAPTTVKTTYKMQRSAFYDGPSLISSLCVVKSFVLAGDAAHSVQFVRYRDEGRQLALLGKDFGRAAVRAAQFLISGSSLHIVMADGAGCLRAFTYAPADPTAWKGQKLIQWGVMGVGEGVGAMIRLKMPQPDATDVTPRQAVVYGCDSGAIGAVMAVAVGEHLMQPRAADGAAKGSVVTALKALQQELVGGVAHGAGLNPAAFRRRHVKVPLALEGTRPYGPPLVLEAQGVLDGDLLMRYVTVSRGVQTRLAAHVGVTRMEVLAVLAAISKSSRLL